jgi:hypothetical protein
MRRMLAATLAVFAVLTGCTSSDDPDGAAAATQSPSAPPSTVAEPTTSAVPATTAPATSTTPAPTTTAAPTGSVTACDGFLTLDDPDADGWGECIVTMEDAREQYYVISGKANGATANLNVNRQADCDILLSTLETFSADLRAAVWPPEVQPQLDELIAANDYELFLMDDTCAYQTQAQLDEASQRRERAVFEWRLAIGTTTDF